MKTKQDNKLTDCIDALYVKNDSKLLWPIGSDALCDDY